MTVPSHARASRPGSRRPARVAHPEPHDAEHRADAEYESDAERDGGHGPVPVDAPLTRDRVLATALAMIDQDGVDALSMRRLGQALHRDPMRLYRHAESKAALLDAVTELVLSEFVIPEVVDGDWAGSLRRAAESYRRVALTHPRMVPLMVTRPLSTPLGLRPLGTLRSLEQLLGLFLGAGFDGRGALYAYRFFVGFLTGHVLHEVQELVADPDETDALLQLGLYLLPKDQFPHMRLLAPVLAAYDGAAELQEGLDVVIGGLRARLDPASPPGARPAPPAAPPAVPPRSAPTPPAPLRSERGPA
ncbi:TetR/AcrR family transcriptional regulator C-terminal domain-containing protein [Nakamurella flavida]|uniref:TetR/AcrR family transcriptional regulator C-terminal domain-containing protein n=1 Tax=Nakamurella flavida TaxID=363630 RepID=A0A939C1M6_9ACTN|nr:TetR/AcrR family transcriptional regulator C-terminal domain-containing protein [Nakamurella flavida]MBM9475620.1 TetR/AcrR family transcriptional regulator C-terminal domain-containing protein [Nakamurella flavida]MDP9778104.1 AcrR family transcriptional regulator [Nakamurella flavida]